MEGDGGENWSEPGDRQRGEGRGGGTTLKNGQRLRIVEVGRDFRNLFAWSSPHHLLPMRKQRLREVNLWIHSHKGMS